MIMKKTHPKSYIKRFHMNSVLASKIFESGTSEIILQIMECSDKEFIAELVNRKDYEEHSTIGE